MPEGRGEVLRTIAKTERINQLSIEQLENLALSLLDFSSQADLATWLQDKSNQL